MSDTTNRASQKNEPRGRKRKDPPFNKNNKLTRKEQKVMKKEKKLKRVNGQLCYDANVLWEEIRKKETTKEKREQMIDSLLEKVKGSACKVVNRRDTSRVLQSVFKYGTPEQKAVLFSELKGNILGIAKNNYGHFTLIKLLKYGTPEQRDAVIKEFYGNVTKLVRQKDACAVLDFAFNEFCKSKQKHAIIEEFYGREYALFKVNEKRTFESITKDNKVALTSIINYLRTFLISALNKPDILSYSIIHKPILIYLMHASDANKFEMIEFLRDHLAHMVHTNDGAKVASLCFAYGKPKDRKLMIKTFKGYAARIAKDEYGHLVILQIINSVDDTVLVFKSLFKELLKDGLELCRDKYAHLCLLAILSGFTSRYFPPSTIELLKPVTVTDPEDSHKQVPTSKKDPEVRRKELLTPILPVLCKICTDSTHELATDLHGHQILIDSYLVVTDDDSKDKMRKSLLSWVNFDPSQVQSEREKMDRKYHPMEERPLIKHDIANDLYAHKVLKTWINHDNEFATQLLDKMSNHLLEYAKLNKTPSIIMELLKIQATKEKVLQLLKPEFKQLEGVSHKSTKKLVEMLNKEK